MTEAINYIQTLFSFNNFAPAKTSAHDKKLVRALVQDAASLADVAKAEAVHGATALNLAQGESESLAENMATIAAWHFERSLRKYKEAAARYGEAGRVPNKNSRLYFAEARNLKKTADEIGARIKFLDGIFN